MRTRCVLIFACLLICVFVGQIAQAANHEEIYARIRIGSAEEKARLFGERGLDVAAAGPDWLDVVLDSRRLKDLTDKGYNVEVHYWTPEERNSAVLGVDWVVAFHTYSDLVTEMQQAALDHPGILILDTLGYSVEGRMILGAKVSDNPTVEENEPEFRIIGNHHGNEYMGVEMGLLTLQYLTDNYGSISQVTHLVNDMETWIIPMMNPDGNTAGTRYNANGVDLNRDYGYMWAYTSPGIFSQPETRVIREHGLMHNFSVSLSFHTSGDVMNYVWNYKDFPLADSAFVVDISEEYGSYNGYWVTEGYEWYVTNGDCNDWSYGSRTSIDATIETANTNITSVWGLNRPAILAMMERTDDGVRGRITDISTGQPVEGMVRCAELGLPVYADPVFGDFQKNLLPGTYSFKFSANGYQDSVISGVVVSSGSPTILNVDLEPSSNYYAVHVVSCQFFDPYTYPNQYINNSTNASAALGLPDGIFASLGKGGHMELDMGGNSPIIDLEGYDFTVYEAGSSDGYNVYWSDVPYGGTWSYLGTGSGTTSFDISSLSVESIRYLKVEDDNDGIATETNPGCDIDAIIHPRAVTNPTPVLVYSSMEISEVSGNGNGEVNPGETVDLSITLKNEGEGDGEEIHADLVSDDPYITIISATSSYPDIAPGDSGTSLSPYRIEIAEECPADWSANLILEIEAQNSYSVSDSFALPVGESLPEFLLGDATGDWIIDLSDVIFLLNYLFRNGPAPNPLEAGDANCNGAVELGDVIYLLNYLFKNGPLPVC